MKDVQMVYFPEQPNIFPVVCNGENFVHNQCYELVPDYYFEAYGQKHYIPSGFRYDGASVPRFLWSVTGITPDGLHRAATLIHDYLYVNRIHGLSRRQVDKLFYEQMLKLGVPKRKALIMYKI
jgi:hypothetical protein